MLFWFFAVAVLLPPGVAAQAPGTAGDATPGY
jgi:hypothetical protein